MNLQSKCAGVILFISLVSPSVEAATECFFTSQLNANIAYNDKIIINEVEPPAEGFKQLTTQGSTQYIPPTPIHSTCDVGQDGQFFSGSVANYQGSLDIYSTIDGKNVELFSTSVLGIFYAVKMYSEACPQMGAMFPLKKAGLFSMTLAMTLKKPA